MKKALILFVVSLLFISLVVAVGVLDRDTDLETSDFEELDAVNFINLNITHHDNGEYAWTCIVSSTDPMHQLPCSDSLLGGRVYLSGRTSGEVDTLLEGVEDKLLGEYAEDLRRMRDVPDNNLRDEGTLTVVERR